MGHALFWLLRAEVVQFGERFGLMLECLLRHCGPRTRAKLDAQLSLVDDLERVSATAAAESAGKTAEQAR